MQFTIESSEGLPIRGDLESTGGARALVVIVHGFKGFKDWGFFPWVAETQSRMLVLTSLKPFSTPKKLAP